MSDEKFLRMTTQPVERLICRLAVPTIVMTLISSVYNLTDTFFVGNLGTSATGAVGVAFSLMAVIQAVGFFFGQGSGNYISRELGAQNVDGATKMAATGLFSSVLFGAAISVVGLLFLDPLARLLGATETILPYALSYMRFILIGAPWMTASLTLNNLLRFQGSAFYGMIGIASGAVLNIALAPLFIFGFHMGIAGAGLATMVSQFVGFCLLLWGCTRKGNVPIHIRNFAPSVRRYQGIFKGGLPSLCLQGLMSIATICLNQLAGRFGDSAIAAISIVQRVMMLAAAAMIGFGQGFQPVCGFNYGAKQYERVQRAFWFCIKVMAVVLTAFSVALFIFAPRVIGIFRSDDADVIRIGALALRFQCVTLPFMSWVILSLMMLQTTGKSAKASLLAIARQGLFLLPILFILVPTIGILGLQLSQPIADAASFGLALPLGIGMLREMQKEQKDNGTVRPN